MSSNKVEQLYLEKIKEHEDNIRKLKDEKEKFKLEFVDYYQKEILSNEDFNDFVQELKGFDKMLIERMNEYFDDKIDDELLKIKELERKIDNQNKLNK